jgi:hypothetical protein
MVPEVFACKITAWASSRNTDRQIPQQAMQEHSISVVPYRKARRHSHRGQGSPRRRAGSRGSALDLYFQKKHATVVAATAPTVEAT